MAVIPFLGGKTLGIVKLPYTLPLTARLGLGYPVFSNTYELGVLQDAFASNFDALMEYVTDVYILRPGAKTDNAITGTSGVIPLGWPFQSSGANMLQPGPPYNPDYCFYDLPGGSVNVANFVPVTASGGPGPGAWENYQAIRFLPVSYQGALAFRLRSEDSSFLPWYTLLVPPASFPTPWQQAQVRENSAAFVDFAGNRTLFLVQAGSTEIVSVIFSAGGVESEVVLFSNASGTGHSWLDIPFFANWNQAAGIHLVGDNSIAGSGPLVLDGSPVFLMLPDLSGYYELIFTPAGPGVIPNDMGGYGPPWDYPNTQSQPLTVTDQSGTVYFIQLNPAKTAYDVYATGAPRSGSVFGSFTSQLAGDRIGGGTI